MSETLVPAAEVKSSSRLLRICRIAVAVLLAAAIVWFVDLGAAFALLQQTDWRWVLVALLLVQAQIVVSAWRWQLTAVRLGHGLSFPVAVREYYLATALNMSLPGGVTGDAARVIRARHGSTLGVAAQGVMIERLAGQIALFVIALLGWLVWPYFLEADAPGIGRILFGMLAGVLGCLALLALLQSRFADNRVSRFISSFGPAMYKVWIADRQWLVQGSLSVIIVTSYLVVFAICAYALNKPVPPVAIITIVPLVLLSMVLPFSVGGWGVREAAAAALWPVAGLTSEAGVATSLLYGAVSIVGCLPGLLLMVNDRWRRL